MNEKHYSSRVSVFGLGKLGAPMLAFFASRGCRVIGVETDQKIREAIDRGEALWYEAGLGEMLASMRASYEAVTDVSFAVLNSDVSFIVVPTPSESDGRFSAKYVEEAVRTIADALKSKDSWHLVVITSTVMPGTTDYMSKVMEEVSGKFVGSGFGLCYSPEFIALGSVIRDLQSPDLLLIGSVDGDSGDKLAAFYADKIGCTAPAKVMSAVSAEIAKIAINSYITQKITFANSIASVCEETPGANVTCVLAAVGSDRRIGSTYLSAGLGYGGPCFPRDNQALHRYAEDVGVGHIIAARTTDSINKLYLDRQVKRILDFKEMAREGYIAVLGLSYKLGTAVITESQGLEIARKLASMGKDVVAYDILASEAAKSRLAGQNIRFATDIREAVSGASVVVVALPIDDWPSFCDSLREGQKVFDCWPGRHMECQIPKGVSYVSIGRCMTTS